MTAPLDDLPVSDYRLAPAVGVRFVGGLLVLVAVLVFATTVVVGLLELPSWLMLAAAGLGVLAVLVGAYVVTKRIAVVRLGPDGYRVRLVRGVGVPAAGWKEVREAVTSTDGVGAPVVVLRLRDERTTTIPVQVLAADREDFVRDLLTHLRHGQGVRPL
ncbi:hypothetical protein [Nocardioides sp. SR21]|uniref:hypothetical protein n=1 Tax=Nocardioides sp. SR21 TaxID=2919501 RepID=UPI001FAAA913|nr:hypothetical protein [Nocardioides sp. SR21]